MTDTILIVGGGVAGLHAALECSRAGARSIVVERRPVIGGKLAAAMSGEPAVAERSGDIPATIIDDVAACNDIEVLTLAGLEAIDGRPGSFSVSIRERARFVTDTCTRCNLCRAVCPVVLPNEYDAGLTYRKAIFTPLSRTEPEAFVIDIDNCLNTPPNYLPCNRCAEVCEDDSIHFDVPLDKVHERQVGAVVVAAGFEIEDGTTLTEFGYGRHKDVVTSAELQRLLESPGPTGGYATKPSDEEYPESVLLVLDDLSPFGLYVVASQVHQLVSQDIDRVEVLMLAQPGAAGEQTAELATLTGVAVRWGAGFRVEIGADKELGVSFEDFSDRRLVKEYFDLVVLCSDVRPADALPELAATLDLGLNATGYLAGGDSEAASSRDGVYVAGCVSGPKDVTRSIAQARAAAAAALADLNPRLLRGDYSPAPATPAQEQAGTAAEESADTGEDDQLRRHIEQLLYGLLQKS